MYEGKYSKEPAVFVSHAEDNAPKANKKVFRYFMAKEIFILDFTKLKDGANR